jgi:hypothetical protein
MHVIHYKTNINYIDNSPTNYIEWVDTIEPCDILLPNEKKAAKKQYYNKVKRLTRKVVKENIEGYVKSNILGSEAIGNFRVFRTSNKLVIDHKISIIYGFNNNIPAEHIADVSNLRYIPSVDNHTKSKEIYVCSSNEWILHSVS